MVYELTYGPFPKSLLCFCPGIQNCWRNIPTRHAAIVWVISFHFTNIHVASFPSHFQIIFSLWLRDKIWEGTGNKATIHVAQHHSKSIPFQDTYPDFRTLFSLITIHASFHVIETEIWNAGNKSVPYTCTQMWFLYRLSYVQYLSLFSSFLNPPFFSLFLFMHLPLLPGSSGFVRYTNIPPGYYKLRVVAWDPVRKERAVIRNRVLVHRDNRFCAVLKTNNGLTIGRNNNVTVEFSGTGRTTGFQCILDKQRPYFECRLLYSFTLRLARVYLNLQESAEIQWCT